MSLTDGRRLLCTSMPNVKFRTVVELDDDSIGRTGAIVNE